MFFNSTTETQPAPTATSASRPTVIPRYRLQETADAYVVTALLPGVARTDIETTVDGENLQVFARRTWTPPTDWAPVHREIGRADFRLGLDLGQRVNRDAVTAELKQGVLTLTLPKAEALKPRKIEIAG
jgi:HSP20 family molecular chaperone IbpA